MTNENNQFEVSQFSTHTFTPARTLEQIPGFCEKLDQFLGKFESSELRQSQSAKTTRKPSKNERAFLDHLSLKEYEPANIIFSRIGKVSSGAQQQTIKSLKKLRLIETVRERTGKMFVTFASLTSSGRKYINKPEEKKSVRGSSSHRKITYLKRDLDIKNGSEKCIFEFPYPNSSGFSDLGSMFNGKWHCTEVVVNCTSNICDHVRSCFIDAAGQVESMTIVTLLKLEHKKILEKILSVPELVFFVGNRKIQFMTLEQILKELYGK